MNIQERLAALPAQVLEWWNKYSVRQKTLMASSVVFVAAALIVLGVLMTRPTWVTLHQSVDTRESSRITALLDEAAIPYRATNDGLTINVEEGNLAPATILLGANNITGAAIQYRWDELDHVFAGGFSATESDKNRRYQLFVENQLTWLLQSVDVVNNATVMVTIPNNDGTILAQQRESHAAITLDLNDVMDADKADGLARLVAAALGSNSTGNISIMDTAGNVLFGGAEENVALNAANNNLSLMQKESNRVSEDVRRLLLGTKRFSTVAVTPRLDLPFTDSSTLDHEYYIGDGLDDPLIRSERRFDSEGAGTVSEGVPGTDTNEGPTYLMPGGENSAYSTSEYDRMNDNSERITEAVTTKGGWVPANSNIAVAVTTSRVYDERDMRRTGALAELDLTFDEFRAANEEPVQMEVDPSIVAMVSNATGIPEANITVVATEVPMFVYDSAVVEAMNYLPIILAAVIMLMLGFVVFRSTRRDQLEPEPVPELSVEDLLESTKELAQENLEDISFAEKSETRIMLENFIDEDPHAAASLLRNWLSDDWE